MNKRRDASGRSSVRRIIRAGHVALIVGMFGSAVAARAAQVDDGCMEDVAGFGLNCTANDVQLSAASNIVVLDDGCQFVGDMVTFSADYDVVLTAQDRYDIGIYFATDGGDALNGNCTIVTLPLTPDPPFIDLDQTEAGQENDACGDMKNDAPHNPIMTNITVTATCFDPDGDGKLNLPNCTSWRQPGANDLCMGPLDAFPGTPSKCRCDDGFTIDIPVPTTTTTTSSSTTSSSTSSTSTSTSSSSTTSSTSSTSTSTSTSSTTSTTSSTSSTTSTSSTSSTSTSTSSTSSTSSTTSTSTSTTTTVTWIDGCSCPDTAFVAARGSRVNNDSLVDGDITVNDPFRGTFKFGRSTLMTNGTSVTAKTVKIGADTSVDDVYTLNLRNSPYATIRGGVFLADLPAFVPFCPAPDVTCGTEDVILDVGEVLSDLAPGAYGKLLLKDGATLELMTPGDFSFCSVKIGRMSRVVAAQDVEVDVLGKFQMLSGSFLGTETGPPLVLKVAGTLVRVSQSAVLRAALTAPNAKFKIQRGGSLIGCMCVDRFTTDKHVFLICEDGSPSGAFVD